MPINWILGHKPQQVPQTCVHNLKCGLHHKAHFMLR